MTKLGNLYPLCVSFFFFCGITESLSNGTRTTGNVTAQRDGREYDFHPAPGSTNNERLEVAVQSLSPRPKSLGSK